jgi:hypothetical protein
MKLPSAATYQHGPWLRDRRFGFRLASGIPTQVVVPSVSLAAVLQGTALTVFVETPSSATLSKPVLLPGSNGPPTEGAAPTTGTPADGGAPEAGGEPGPIVSGVCCAKTVDEPRASNAAMERVIIRIELSFKSVPGTMSSGA